MNIKKYSSFLKSLKIVKRRVKYSSFLEKYLVHIPDVQVFMLDVVPGVEPAEPPA